MYTIEQPEGCQENDEDGTKLVCKLDKSTYALKQASKNWYDRLKTFIVKENFKQSKSDYCLYVKKQPEETIYVLVWIDDIILATSNLQQIQELK